MAVVYLYGIWSRYYSEKIENFYDFIYERFPFYKEIIKRDELSVILKQINSGLNSPVNDKHGQVI